MPRRNMPSRRAESVTPTRLCAKCTTRPLESLIPNSRRLRAKRKHAPALNMMDGAIPLIEKVRSAGVVDHYVLFGEGNMRRWDWEKMGGKLRGETKDLWRFLLLGEKFPQAEAEKLLGKKAIGFLRRHKLCDADNGQLSLGSRCLLAFRDHLFFAD